MDVEVLVFGAAAERVKRDRIVVTVGENPTVQEILAALHEQHLELRFALSPAGGGRLAVNHRFAAGDQGINRGDELALISLVGGG